MRPRVCLALCLLSHTAAAQSFAFGVKGGAPFSSESLHGPDACANAASGPVCGNNDAYVKPYAVGPTVEAFLPWKLSLEADVLYRHFHQDISEGLTAPHGGPVSFGRRAGLTANAWYFPLLVKYSPLRRKVSPFVSAGTTLRHLGPFEGQGVAIDFFLRPQPQTFRIDNEAGRSLDVSVTAGAGFRSRLAFLDVSPEIRFIHWTSGFQPVRNQAMLMLGVTFPVRR